MTPESVTESPVDDWRTVGGLLSAWFEAPSLTAAARLAPAVAGACNGLVLSDARIGPTGVRVRIGTTSTAPRDPDAGGDDLRRAAAGLGVTISEAAADLGLAPDPTALQDISIGLEATNREATATFWQTVTGYRDDGEFLTDGLRRGPRIAIHAVDTVPSLRNRMHIDVVRPADAVAAAVTSVGRQLYGVYGLTLADPDGTEVDLVPGDRFDTPSTDHWRVIFAAKVCYRAVSAPAAADFAVEVAGLAHAAGVPLQIDVHERDVTIDSVKDLWEDHFQPPGNYFATLAAQIQQAAGGRLTPERTEDLSFVQVGIDAVDVPAVRAFWTAALGYRTDSRAEVTDIYDPRRLGPEIIFQPMDPGDTARQAQRDRACLLLDVPAETFEARVQQALAAGGRLAEVDAGGEEPLQQTVIDPEGNRLVIVAR